MVTHPTSSPESLVQEGVKIHTQRSPACQPAPAAEKTRTERCMPTVHSFASWGNLLPCLLEKQPLHQRLGFIVSEFSGNLDGGQ